ncbi:MULTISPECIES: hypothetical protein [unclassified Gemella]|uniref:hypothetical protein n=1 Tax=unclassified Gemella TaxID=2624949 RepID=UPI001C0590BB|nr:MULTISPECIES: hypothetical protein [unclassified Gemella]MBU0279349.1 hypothetical protein [Gemella sp. zg-1178]QWQ39302.1 hypothetical protein KMP11_02965 [Gemella sp. zg-570]
MKPSYYYCPDYKKYVKEKDGIYYKIEDKKEIPSNFYLKINIGSIFTEDITEEEYYAQLC